jgi:hypothetical protein
MERGRSFSMLDAHRIAQFPVLALLALLALVANGPWSDIVRSTSRRYAVAVPSE